MNTYFYQTSPTYRGHVRTFGIGGPAIYVPIAVLTAAGIRDQDKVSITCSGDVITIKKVNPYAMDLCSSR